ncbi:ABC transporter permease [Roseobacter sp. HKCCA0434]|uniref:ABC transporter permease n=1 Tax=Roseobacter sp. HKCCA0434 TaxID=3079297 RepID=UPI00290596F5|nr:ABC transporter permease [Roseobacter sp. HKCCA0434]
MTMDDAGGGRAPNDHEASVRARREEAVANFERPRDIVGRVQHALHVTPALVPLIVLTAAIIGFTWLLGTRFLEQLPLIMQQVQIVGVLAAAQTLIILTAGIDLSVGAIAVFSSVVIGQVSFRYGVPPALSIAAGLAIGSAIGAASGWLVSKIKLPPFIVTLGMWQIVLATNYLYSRNETIRSREIREEAPMMQWLGAKPNEQIVQWIEASRGIEWERRRPPQTDSPVLDFLWATNITYGVLVMILLFAVLAYALRATAWGRHVYAVGDDPEAAALAGVNVRRTLMSVYILAGAICAVAGWIMIGRFGSVSPSASTGVLGNIQSITAVVIGGISLFGGRGSIWGAFFGALIVGVFELGLRMAGADAQWTYLLIGTLIIGAVGVDQWIRKVSA